MFNLSGKKRKLQKTKTFKVITFGCRVNQAESRAIGQQLCGLGWKNIGNEKSQADLIIINSCSVTAKAEKEVRQAIRKIKRENKDCFLAVTGCWINKFKNENSNLKINLLIPNKDKNKIDKIIQKQTSESILGAKNRRINYKDKYAQSGKALVKIQEGCNKFCSYCLVPYLRGRSRSRPADEIIKEIESLSKKGIKEIILTGIDISDYQFKIADWRFKKKANNLNINKYKGELVKLLRLILSLTAVEKISFGSINLHVFDEEFINFCSVNSRLTTHFHIPLQSGCDATLRRMNRKYTVFDFESRILKLKKRIAGFTFSTDIIVGFPGETKDEFQTTLNFLVGLFQKLGKRFKKIHIFRYSPRSGTLAFKMLGKKGWEAVKEEKKTSRAKKIKLILSRLRYIGYTSMVEFKVSKEINDVSKKVEEILFPNKG